MAFTPQTRLALCTDDFSFTCWNQQQQKDAIVIFQPADAITVSTPYMRSKKSLEEQIARIRERNIQKAVVVANDIQFLKQCPSLTGLKVYPSIDAENFDYSPLYELPNLQSLRCETMYGLRTVYDVAEEIRIANVDYSRFSNLKKLEVVGQKGHQNVHLAGELKALRLIDYNVADSLAGVLPGSSLEMLELCLCPTKTLYGIEAAPQLQKLELKHMRNLTDISSLYHVRDSLGFLTIDTCGKIKDFSVLKELHNLEHLRLRGSNILPDLSFLENMPKLKALNLIMKVADGNLHLLERIPWVYVENRKHYTHKDTDLSKVSVPCEKVYPEYYL